jgi:hypothetical protein
MGVASVCLMGESPLVVEVAQMVDAGTPAPSILRRSRAARALLSAVRSSLLLVLGPAEQFAPEAQGFLPHLEDGGHLISVEHMDGAQIGSIEMAARPAPRCALGGRARNFEDGRSELPGRYYPIITAIRGDLSVMLDGKAIGAIGLARILCE